MITDLEKRKVIAKYWIRRRLIPPNRPSRACLQAGILLRGWKTNVENKRASHRQAVRKPLPCCTNPFLPIHRFHHYRHNDLHIPRHNWILDAQISNSKFSSNLTPSFPQIKPAAPEQIPNPSSLFRHCLPLYFFFSFQPKKRKKKKRPKREKISRRIRSTDLTRDLNRKTLPLSSIPIWIDQHRIDSIKKN